jgi:hypothetical protein
MSGRTSARPSIDAIGVGPGRLRVLRIALLLGSLGLFGVLILGRLSSEDRGLDSAQEVGAAYVLAVRAQDRDALRRLTPPDFEAGSAVEEKLQLYLEVHGRPVNIHYLPIDVTPNVVAAIVEADGLQDRIAIQRLGAKWYLMIGYLRDQQPGPLPAEPRN